MDPKSCISLWTISDHVGIEKYKNIFAKGSTPNCSEKVFTIKKVKNTVTLTYLIENHNCEKVAVTFYENELQKTNQTEFRTEKSIKTKDYKLSVKF